MYKQFYVCRRTLVTFVTEDGPGDPLVFFEQPLCRKTSKKEGGFIEKKKKKKSHSAEKIWKDPLVSPGIVSYAEKKNNIYISVPCAKWSQWAPLSTVGLWQTTLVRSCGLKKVTTIVAFHFIENWSKQFSIFLALISYSVIRVPWFCKDLDYRFHSHPFLNRHTMSPVFDFDCQPSRSLGTSYMSFEVFHFVLLRCRV